MTKFHYKEEYRKKLAYDKMKSPKYMLDTKADMAWGLVNQGRLKPNSMLGQDYDFYVEPAKDKKSFDMVIRYNIVS